MHEDSLVLQVTYHDVQFLFPGDLDPSHQKAYFLEGTDVVTWPHHGDVLSVEWRERFQKIPWIVLSVGPNTLGLPQPVAGSTLLDRALRTDRLGDIELWTDGATIKRAPL